eukprot:CAMPEP_0194212568 /NCGR_PEP_ID=MMETSP0156-20130528/12600_1 /TAXON_ID=33649 /ORGANISM="Thalassionema nitzschioides, Strain L26-B" /LENGTH=411 /DNA_ID=CAMNT_0038940427 /DNA_START=202 /DNA_END=1440 /DNA_ORIENTATION=-
MAMLLVSPYGRKLVGVRAFNPLIRFSRPSALISTRQGPDENTSPLSSFTSLQERYKLPVVPDIIPLKANQRVVCVGDVHGDINALKRFLKLAEVFDGNKWTGGNTILVQCGDVLDRGLEELECFSLLTSLSKQAAEHEGSLICLWGNHEALNAAGLFQYTMGDDEYENEIGQALDVSPLDTKLWRIQFGGNQPSRWASYEPGGIFALPLMAHLKVAVQVGKTVCVHAGLTQQHLDMYGGLNGMNNIAQEWIKEAHHRQNNNFGEYISVEEVIKDANNRAKLAAKSMPNCLGGGSGESSPVWMRTYSYPPNVPPRQSEKAQAILDEVLTTLDADRMVVGHTVQNQINAALRGKVWRVDVGASRGVSGGTPEVLEIVKQPDGGEEVSILTERGRIPQKDREVSEEAAILKSLL